MSISSRRAQCFRDLIVYQRARKVAQSIFNLSQSFPTEEIYSLTDQVRRSSRSIGAQISEAWGKRRYERHFVSKLTDADSEQLETQRWLEVAFDCAYISESQSTSLCNELKEIGRMLNSMIHKAETFCKTQQTVVREKSAEYFIAQD